MSKTADTNDGVCNSDCSLREAIARARPGDVIELPAGTYTLTSQKSLTIDKDLELSGQGADTTIIEAATTPGEADFRVIDITGGVVNISGVTIRHGGTIADPGSGIRNNGTLTITNSVITENHGGGGILNIGSNLIASTIDDGAIITLINTIVSGNSSSRSGGGITAGVREGGGTINLVGSTVSGNSTLVFGGGIFVLTSIFTMNDSTVSGNTARLNGGGIHASGRVSLTNSTVSGNTTEALGGGIYSPGATLTNTTVTGNSGESAGGIFAPEWGSLTMRNSIVAGNSASIRPDCQGQIISLGHNVIGDQIGCFFVAAAGDLVGDADNPIDPMVGPLRDNGGSTFTHAELPGSPAIDAGDDTDCPATDQRGTLRPQGAACDIGAYER